MRIFIINSISCAKSIFCKTCYSRNLIITRPYASLTIMRRHVVTKNSDRDYHNHQKRWLGAKDYFSISTRHTSDLQDIKCNISTYRILKCPVFDRKFGYDMGYTFKASNVIDYIHLGQYYNEGLLFISTYGMYRNPKYHNFDEEALRTCKDVVKSKDYTTYYLGKGYLAVYIHRIPSKSGKNLISNTRLTLSLR